MNVNGTPFQSIWTDPSNPERIRYINQLKLPFEFDIAELLTSDDAIRAIKDMEVRGAPLIGVTGAFGIYLACLETLSGSLVELDRKAIQIRSARPTAVNLARAVDRVMDRLKSVEDPGQRTWVALEEAVKIMEEEKEASIRIGQYGLDLLRSVYKRKQDVVNILTHCNAGWLACIDYGTATAPIYAAYEEGIPVHVWVDETRPRNQGARLTAWELGQHGVDHTVIVDNAGGHLMQHGRVDMVFVGSDRTTARGDVANKIGTYLKALAARENNIPFYVALPSSSIDFSIQSGLDEIEIEERDSSEVGQIEGRYGNEILAVNILPEFSKVSNYGFDVTPANLVTGLITEMGICRANEESIRKLLSEK